MASMKAVSHPPSLCTPYERHMKVCFFLFMKEREKLVWKKLESSSKEAYTELLYSYDGQKEKQKHISLRNDSF